MANATGVDAVNALVKKHSQGEFIKLKDDGDSVVGCFLGEPHAYETVWNGSRTENYDASKHANESPSLKVTWNFYDLKEKKMRIITFNTTTYGKAIEAREKYSFDGKAFEVKRSGVAKSQDTSYSVLFEKDIPADEWKDIANLDRHNLPEKAAGRGASASGGGANVGSNGAAASNDRGDLIDEDKAQGLIARLKQLPAESLDAFLNKFGVERIRDVPAAKLDEAMNLVAEFEGGSKTASKDPFA